MSGDKYYVYRPLLDLIGLAEGTARGRGYNETLAYGALTNGPVELVKMTLREVDALQSKMLKHPDNKWGSSAVGWYQITRTTLRNARRTLSLSLNDLFNEDMQDRLACYLLGVRGIDKYLAGRLKEDTLINNLAQEWASFPTIRGNGYYKGQKARVSVDRVRAALEEVRKRHLATAPAKVEKTYVPVAPKGADRPGRDVLALVGSGVSFVLSSIAALDWRVQLALVAVGVVGISLAVTGRLNIAKSVRELREAVSE